MIVTLPIIPTAQPISGAAYSEHNLLIFENYSINTECPLCIRQDEQEFLVIFSQKEIFPSVFISPIPMV